MSHTFGLPNFVVANLFPEVGIYKENKKVKKLRKQELDQESNQENKKKERKQELDQESDQEKKEKTFFFS